MKVKVKKKFNYKNKPRNEGDIVDLPEEKAKNVVSKGYGEKVDNKNAEKIEKFNATTEEVEKIKNLFERLDWSEEKQEDWLDNFGVNNPEDLTPEQADSAIDNLTTLMARNESEQADKPNEGQEYPTGIPSGVTQQEGMKLAQKMEKMDEEQIASDLDAVPSEALKDYFYQFDHKGRTVTGLSYIGAMALFSKCRNIHIEILDNIDKGDHYMVKVRARDHKKNLSIERIVRQPKKMTLKSGNKIDDEFADRKAESKAIKKAIQALIPHRVVSRAYEKWQEKIES